MEGKREKNLSNCPDSLLTFMGDVLSSFSTALLSYLLSIRAVRQTSHAQQKALLSCGETPLCPSTAKLGDLYWSILSSFILFLLEALKTIYGTATITIYYIYEYDDHYRKFKK